MIAHFLKATAFFVKFAHLSKAMVLVFYAKCYLSHFSKASLGILCKMLFVKFAHFSKAIVLVLYAECYLSN